METSESKVISAVLRNQDVHSLLGEDVEVFGAYGDIAGFIKNHYLEYKVVPSLALIESEFPGVEFPETTAPTAFYMDSLRSQYVTQKMQDIMFKASDAMKRKTGPEILTKMQTELAKLGRFTNNVRDLDMTDADNAEEYFKKIREISQEKGGTPGISTGFKSIDSAYPTGMGPGHSIILMGYTGKSKSMFADLLAVKAWEQGYHPMIISLEMSPEEQRERIYALMASGLFQISDLSIGDLSTDSFREWSKKKFEGKNKFTIVSNQGVAEVTPNTIQAKIDTHRPDIVILDYLQLMKDNGRTQGMTPRMLNLSREIKMLAVTNAIPVVSITAVTDEDGDKRDAPPVLSQVSWSSGIEYDANLAIAVHRHDDSDIVEVVARKNRHGELFDFGFLVDFNRGIWEEKHDLF